MPATQNQPIVPPASSRRARPQDAGSTMHGVLVATSWVAGVFCAVLCAVMFYHHLTATTNDPWKSPQLIALKEKLVAESKNEPLKQEIRRLDFEFRQQYRRRLALDGLGGWLLLGGALVLVLAAKRAADLHQKLPLPQPKPDAAEQARRFAARARWSVTGVGLVVGLALLTLAFTAHTWLPTNPAELDRLLGKSGSPGNEVAAELPPTAEFQANWPRFRGPDGGGFSAQTNLPLSWNAKTGAGVAWNLPIPSPGHNSPIVWGHRVFFSGGTAAKREVFCCQAASGQLVWQRALENVPGSPARPPEILESTGFAASTMAADGRRVYVIFANGDLAALTLDGAPVWLKNLGAPRNPYGHAASLAVWQGRLIVQFDQGQNAESGSKLLAFDGASGRELWSRSRPVPASWATPIVIEAGGRMQIITLGVPWVIGYALADGRELWRAEVLEGEVTPSPVFAGGLVIVVSPSTKLMAIRPDGEGDVTKTHVAWTVEDNVPDVTSPVSNGELVFTVTTGGLVTCFDATNGKKVWEQDLEMEVQSSPGIAGDRLFLLSTKGVFVVAQAGRQFKELARSELPDRFLASPAIGQNRIFLRGVTNLYCIGGDKKPGEKF